MFGGNILGQLGLGVKPVACKPASVRGLSLNFITSSNFIVNIVDIDHAFFFFYYFLLLPVCWKCYVLT